MTQAPIIGIQRHRITTDGEGVTTLVGFWGCPLQCKYCLNPQSWTVNHSRIFTPEQLYNDVSIDQLYFLATGGGITFGGGEPFLYPEFIKEFRALCGDVWNITLETSLNVPLKNIQQLQSYVNNYIVDIKELNDVIYQKYTGKSNHQVIENLLWLIENVDKKNIIVRVPIIPEYNNEEMTKETEKWLIDKEIKNIDIFNYITKTFDDKLEIITGKR